MSSKLDGALMWLEGKWPRWATVLAVVVTIILCALTACSAYAAPTVTLTANPTTGISPLNVTLTWSSTESTGCVASGAWTGTKAVSGSETVSNLRAANGAPTAFSFGLTCSGSEGSATLTWTLPTQNTDTSAIPATGPGSLAGIEIYHAPTSGAVATSTPVIVNQVVTTYTLTGLPAGNRYYALKVFNAEGVRSNITSNVNNVVSVPGTTAMASVTVNVQPKPPTLVTVAATVYEITTHPNEGIRLARLVGSVPLGTECLPDAVVQSFGATYYAVPPAAVSFVKVPKSNTVVAQCAAVEG